MVPIERLVKKPWAVEPVSFGKRPIIINIDNQKFFTSPSSPFNSAAMPGFDSLTRAVQGQKRLFEHARARNIQIAHTVVAFRKDGKDRGLWKPLEMIKLCTEGSVWAQIDDEIAPHENDLFFVRKKPSAFFGTPFLEMMIAGRYDTLIITGSNTSGCIRATTNESFMYGFHTILPVECIGDLTGEGPHWANLSDVNGRYADVITLDDVLAYFESLPKQEAL
jgi:maleamate amidohydrolase